MGKHYQVAYEVDYDNHKHVWENALELEADDAEEAAKAASEEMDDAEVPSDKVLMVKDVETGEIKKIGVEVCYSRSYRAFEAE